jgi:futalosine hydrolase
MNIYIFSATTAEVAAAHSFCTQHISSVKAISKHSYATFITKNNNTISFVCHGVGAAYAQLCIQDIAINGQPSLLFQAGIAGVYVGRGSLEQVYHISADRFADLGAQDGDSFLTLGELNLAANKSDIDSNGWMLNVQQAYPAFFAGLPQAKGITVNMVTGSEATMQRWQNLYKPHTESMEGAALHLVALTYKIPFVQVRAMSNYVQVRDKSQWKIPEALHQLNATIIEYINTL